jgi:hypothetical protein
MIAHWPSGRFRFRGGRRFHTAAECFSTLQLSWIKWAIAAPVCGRCASAVRMEKVLQNSGNSEKRRSERLNLTVPVLVTTATVDGREIQEITETAIVNAHGGLFRSTVEFLVAQPLILTNLNTNLKESARVVHAEVLASGGFGVAFEFDNAAPEFWQLEDAPDDWGALGLSEFGSELAN